MNVLTDQFPDKIEIDSVEYAINTDFRASIATLIAFEDPELTIGEKYEVLLKNLYQERPSNMQKAITLGIMFLDRGERHDDSGVPGVRLYSFDKDASFIFAAFRQTHGIDLETENMHWWKFLSLFMDIGQNTAFSSIVGLRQRLNNGTASKDERKMAIEMHDILSLENVEQLTYEEREAEDAIKAVVRRGKELRRATRL